MDPEYGSPQPLLPPPREKMLPIARRKGLGTKGIKIPLLSNHCRVNISNVDGHIFHYSVNLFDVNGSPVNAKGLGRKIIDMVKETYGTELGGKDFTYDGEKSLFTVGSLPGNKFDFMVVLQDVVSSRTDGHGYPDQDPNGSDMKRLKRPYKSELFNVEILFAAKIPMQAFADLVKGQENKNTLEALRVLNIVLRQHAEKQGCLLVRQSFFSNSSRSFTNVGGGVLQCSGFHSTFRGSQAGLSLNIDVSSTMIIQPGPVVDFLLANQNVSTASSIDWAKAKRMLRNLRIKTTTSNQEFKITGLSDLPCKEQTFTFKERSEDGSCNPREVNIAVYDYFVNVLKMDLHQCEQIGLSYFHTYRALYTCLFTAIYQGFNEPTKAIFCLKF